MSIEEINIWCGVFGHVILIAWLMYFGYQSGYKARSKELETDFDFEKEDKK